MKEILAGRPAGPPRRLSRRFDLQQDHPRMVEEDASRRRQFDRARTAEDQRRAQLRFQVADLPAQGGLGGVQPLPGGVGEAAFLRDRDEVAQVPEFHACHAFAVWCSAYKVFFRRARNP